MKDINEKFSLFRAGTNEGIGFRDLKVAPPESISTIKLALNKETIAELYSNPDIEPMQAATSGRGCLPQTGLPPTFGFSVDCTANYACLPRTTSYNVCCMPE